MNGEPCPRCGEGLVSFQTAAEIAAAIRIEPSLKADERTYQARLAVCMSCASLREGVLCSRCGCFVLFRARPKNGRCPHPRGDRWKEGVRTSREVR
ncbi:MAG: DUF6171 family protein [Treponema sp.]|nr:DUF6171 family protein [Treponema sp.]